MLYTILWSLFFQIMCKDFQNQDCLEPNPKNNEIYFQKIESSFIIQSNTSDISKINNVGYEIIEKNFTLNFPSQGKIISVLYVENQMNDNQIYFKTERHQVCVLTDNEKHYDILCNKLENFKEENIDQQGFDIKSIQKIQNETCQFLFQNNNKIPCIACFSDSYWKIYYIEKQEIKSVISYHNITNFQNCKVKLKSIGLTNFLGFLNCAEWALYKINQQLYGEIIIDFKSSQKQYNNSEILKNLQVCQQYLYLTFATKYYRQSSSNLTNIFNQESIKLSEDLELTKLVFLNTCNQIGFLIERNQNYIIYSNLNKSLELGTNISHVRGYQNLLFLSNSNSLRILFSKDIQQNYTINLSKIIFFESNNFFYIDQCQKKVNYIQLLNVRGFFRPSMNFLFEIQSQSWFEAYQIMFCQQYQGKSRLLNETSNQIVFLGDSQCQSQAILQITYLEFQYSFVGPYKLVFVENNMVQQNQFIFQVLPSLKLLNICQNQSLKTVSDTKLLYYSLNPQSVIFRNKDKIFFIYCQNIEKNHVIDVTNKSVIQSKGKIIIEDCQKNQLEIHSFISGFYNQFQIQLQNICSYYKILLEFILCFHLDAQKVSLINLRFPQENPIYLEDQLIIKNETIEYFQAESQYAIIQYEKLLLAKHKKKYSKFLFDQQTIIYSWQDVFRIFLFSIHKIDSVLYSYIYYDEELTLLQQYSLVGYEIVRPIQYMLNTFMLAILVTNSSNQFLMLFKIKHQLVLEDIIQIGNENFYLNENMIIFVDLQKEFSYKNLHVIYVERQQQVYPQLNLITSISQDFKLISQLEPAISQSGKMIIKNVNFCRRIFFLIKMEILKIIEVETLGIFIKAKSKIFYFNPQNLFVGEIDSLKVEVNFSNILTGPVIEDIQIQECQLLYNIEDYVCFLKGKFDQQGIEFQFLQIQNYQRQLYIFQENIYQKALYQSEYQYLLIINSDGGQYKFYLYDLNQVSEKQSIKPLQLNFSDMKQGIRQFNVKFRNKIVLIANLHKYQYVLVWHEQYLESKTVNPEMIDIVNIEDSEDNYLVMNGVQSPSTIQLCLVNIENFFKCFNEIKIDLNNILSNLQLQEALSESIIKEKFQLLSASQISSSLVKIVSAYMSQKIFFLFFISYDTLRNKIDVFNTKILRLPDYKDQIELYFMNSNIIILHCVHKEFFYYDITGNKSFYDYLTKYYDEIKIYEWNNTHYVFNKVSLDQVFLGKFGFQISLPSFIEENLSCKIKAQNSISSAQIEVIFETENSLNYEFTVILVVGLIIFSFLMYYLKRREKLKYSVVQNNSIIQEQKS